jgi:hypothetical protein
MYLHTQVLMPEFANWMPTDYISQKELIVKKGPNAHIMEYHACYAVFLRSKEYEFRVFWIQWFVTIRRSPQKLELLTCIASLDPTRRRQACQLFFGGLLQVCRKMLRVDRTWANTHLNFRISFHSGWLAMCGSLHVIATAPAGARGTVNFGDPKRCYRFCDFTQEAQDAIVLLHKGQAIMSLYDAPTSVAEWGQAVSRMSSSIQALVEDAGALSDPESYKFLWNARANLEGARMAAGVSKFKVPAGMTVAKFAANFPDQHEYLVRWAKHLKVGSIKALAAKIKYKGPLHLLTMYACLLMDARIRQFDPKTLKTCLRKLPKHRKSNRSKFGHEGHPGAAVRDAMQEVLKSES